MKLQFDIRFGFLFPWTFQFIGVLLVITSIILIPNIFWLSLVLFPSGLLIIFTFEGVEIDDAKKVYREYYSFFLVKIGKFKSYDSIEKLFINKKVESQRMYSAHTNKAATFSNGVYDGYLKFSSGEKILLLSKKNKEKLMERLNEMSRSLNVQLIDNS